MRKELETRLIRFASNVLSLKQYINSSYEGEHLAKQLVRSGTSVALNFGEVQAAESKKDFIHKQGIILKELRESYINMKIIEINNLCSNISFLSKVIDENEQLIRIFTKSIQTSKKSE